MIKLALFFVGLVFLSGCTITGEPRSENVAFDGEGYVVTTETLKNSISVGKVSDFPGTSNFTYSGRLAPNFSDESFKEVLEESLKNSSLYGNSYILNAKLIDSGDWSDWGTSLGSKSRRIEIEYTLADNNNIIYNETIVSDIARENYNPLAPAYLTQRVTAEVNYAENIKLLIEDLNKL